MHPTSSKVVTLKKLHLTMYSSTMLNTPINMPKGVAYEGKGILKSQSKQNTKNSSFTNSQIGRSYGQVDRVLLIPDWKYSLHTLEISTPHALVLDVIRSSVFRNLTKRLGTNTRQRSNNVKTHNVMPHSLILAPAPGPVLFPDLSCSSV
jgi:hypothetical protein